MPSQYQETDNNGTTLLLQKNFTWGQNAAGNAFVSRVDSTLNPGSSNTATTSTVQALDAYGNLTQQQVYERVQLGLAHLQPDLPNGRQLRQPLCPQSFGWSDRHRRRRADHSDFQNLRWNGPRPAAGSERRAW